MENLNSILITVLAIQVLLVLVVATKQHNKENYRSSVPISFLGLGILYIINLL